MRGFMAEVERVKIRERTNRGRRARAAGGKMMPGPRPLYGYQWRDSDRSALEPNPETAPVVQRIFRELAAGKSMRQVVKGLTDDGIPTATGAGRWEISSLAYSCDKSGISGNFRAFRTKREKRAGRKVSQPEKWGRSSNPTPRRYCASSHHPGDVCRGASPTDPQQSRGRPQQSRPRRCVAPRRVRDLRLLRHQPRRHEALPDWPANYRCQSSAGQRGEHKGLA